MVLGEKGEGWEMDGWEGREGGKWRCREVNKGKERRREEGGKESEGGRVRERDDRCGPLLGLRWTCAGFEGRGGSFFRGRGLGHAGKV